MFYVLRQNLSTRVHIHECDSESFIILRLAVCRHYINISLLLYLINAVVGNRDFQEDTFKNTLPCCRLKPATRMPLKTNHTESPTHIEPRKIDQCSNSAK